MQNKVAILQLCSLSLKAFSKYVSNHNGSFSELLTHNFHWSHTSPGTLPEGGVQGKPRWLLQSVTVEIQASIVFYVLMYKVSFKCRLCWGTMFLRKFFWKARKQTFKNSLSKIFNWSTLVKKICRGGSDSCFLEQQCQTSILNLLHVVNCAPFIL